MLELIPYEYNGVRLYIRSAVAAAEMMIVREVQESYTWNFAIRYALDVGAHIGSWTLCARHRHPGAQIAAVEVDALNMLLLRLNTFEMPGIILYAARCGYLAGDYYVGRHSYNSGSTRVYPAAELEKIQSAEPYRTFYPAPPHITIEQVMHECGFPYLDVLKLDCEGAEVEIFNGMDGHTLHNIAHIVGEIHTLPDVFEQQTQGRLQRAGFQVTYTPHPANPQYSAFHAWR